MGICHYQKSPLHGVAVPPELPFVSSAVGRSTAILYRLIGSVGSLSEDPERKDSLSRRLSVDACCTPGSQDEL